MSVPSRNNSFVSNMLRQTIYDIKNLIRSEIRLATAEVKENAMTMGRGGGMVVVGALLGLYAFGLLLMALVELLEEIMPDWLARLMVGLVVGAVGGCFAMMGRQRIRDADLMPQRTMESINEDIDMIESAVH